MPVPPDSTLTTWTPVVSTQAQTTTLTGPAGDYRLWISAPSSEPPPGGFPAVWVLDGAILFASVSEAAGRMATRPAVTGVPPMVVIGVDHEPTSAERRHRDYTHGSSQAADVASRPFGGGSQMLDMLIHQARDMVGKVIPLDPARQTLLGHSLSGLFALHAMATRPDAFAAFGAISPSIWWHPADLATALRGMPNEGQRLFIAVGEREEPAADAIPPDPRRLARKMITGARSAADLATERLGADAVSLVVASGEDHASTVIATAPGFLRFANTVD